MIGVGFKVEVKKSRVLTDGGRALARPRQEATQCLAGMILTRIRQGRGPIGPWNTYGSTAREGGEALFWVAPKRPQPGPERSGDGLKFRVTSGPWAGWAAYESARAYYRLRGLEGQPHDFEESGALLRAAAIRMVNPRHGRLAFYGGHGKQSAKQVGWLASRNESSPLLMPSAEEVERFQRYISEHLNERIVEAARMGASAQALSRGAALSRRASRLLGD